MDKYIDQFKDKFIEEASDILQELEKSLLLLEKKPKSKDLIDNVFRAMHTLKGGGAMFGFNLVSSFTHHFENLFDLVRKESLSLTNDIINLTFESIDHIKNLLKNKEILDDNLNNKHKYILNRIEEYLNLSEKDRDKVKKNIIEEINREKESIFFIGFYPDKNIMLNGSNPFYLVEDVSKLGQAFVVGKASLENGYSNYNPELCYTKWYIILRTERSISEIHDIFLFVEDECKLDIVLLDNVQFKLNKTFFDKIRSFIYENDCNTSDLIEHINNLFKENIGNEQIDLKPNIENSGYDSLSTIRVSSAKLDELMNVVSEIVSIQAKLALFAEREGNEKVKIINEELEKTTKQLRDNVFNIRLIPLSTILIRFNRLIRELSSETGKEIDFITEGTDTELDKNSIELLVDPIMHLIRNSVDHGIEDKNTRLLAGKPEKGIIKLKAFYSGTNVCIQIIDDGKGISVERIKDKAIELGFLKKGEKISEKEILDFIFLPGFTTAQKVSNISGRGVGMDVVKKKVIDLRGDISILTHPGQGTTITLTIPITLSIIEGLLFTIGQQFFIIPMAVVDKCYKYDKELTKGTLNNLFYNGTEYIPYIDLHVYFDIKSNPTDELELIIVGFDNQKVGLIIDKVVGVYQAVLKPLGKFFREQDFISGGSILGDGSIALVIDTYKMIKKFSESISNSLTQIA